MKPLLTIFVFIAKAHSQSLNENIGQLNGRGTFATVMKRTPIKKMKKELIIINDDDNNNNTYNNNDDDDGNNNNVK